MTHQELFKFHILCITLKRFYFRVPELPRDSHKEAFLCACCWHYSKDKDCECNPKAPSFPVCFPSHQQPNFFPPLWRQQQRRLTSGTMEQLLISINGLRVARGFMRLRAFFFIPFIWIEWNFPSHRFMTGTLKMNLLKKKSLLEKTFRQWQNSSNVMTRIFFFIQGEINNHNNPT